MKFCEGSKDKGERQAREQMQSEINAKRSQLERVRGALDARNKETGEMQSEFPGLLANAESGRLASNELRSLESDLRSREK